MTERPTNVRFVIYETDEGNTYVDDIREYSLPQGFTLDLEKKSHRRKIMKEFGLILDGRFVDDKPISRIELEIF